MARSFGSPGKNEDCNIENLHMQNEGIDRKQVAVYVPELCTCAGDNFDFAEKQLLGTYSRK